MIGNELSNILHVVNFKIIYVILEYYTIFFSNSWDGAKKLNYKIVGAILTDT